MRRLAPDGWVALGLLVACGFFMQDLLATEGAGAYVKTTTLPTALVAVLMLLALALLAGALLRPARQGPVGAADAAAGAAGAGLLRVAALLVLTAAYVGSLPWLGYLVATITFLALANILFGNRRWLFIAVIAVAVPTALLLFFEKFMIVLLPSSRLFG